MQFKHTSRRFKVWYIKQKKSLGKTVLKMWSQICGTKNSCIHQSAFRKKFKNYKGQKTKNNKNIHNLCQPSTVL